MKTWITTLALFLTAGAVAASDPSPLLVQEYGDRIREKDWLKINLYEHVPRQFVQVLDKVAVACVDEPPRLFGKALSPPTTRVIEIDAGVYRIDETLHHKKSEREWLLIPVQSRERVQYGHNSSAGRTWAYQHSVAFDPETLALFPREVVRYTQGGRYLDGSPWEEGKWTFGCASFSTSTGSKPLVRFATEEEFRSSQLASQDARAATWARDSEERERRHRERMESERPSKLEVGASLCKLSDGVLLQGFNEGRSPDNDKIRIRIWRGSFPVDGKPGNLVPGGFRETTVWDSVDNWNLCGE